MEMYIVNGSTKGLSEKYNYFIPEEEVFVFNEYKTAKLYKTQYVKIPKELMDALFEYIELNPFIDEEKRLQPLLVNANGTPEHDNFITRQLNNALGRKVGSSMIRHIYLTEKFGDVHNEMKETARKMGHSVDEALNTYVKK